MMCNDNKKIKQKTKASFTYMQFYCLLIQSVFSYFFFVPIWLADCCVSWTVITTYIMYGRIADCVAVIFSSAVKKMGTFDRNEDHCDTFFFEKKNVALQTVRLNNKIIMGNHFRMKIQLNLSRQP